MEIPSTVNTRKRLKYKAGGSYDVDFIRRFRVIRFSSHFDSEISKSQKSIIVEIPMTIGNTKISDYLGCMIGEYIENHKVLNSRSLKNHKLSDSKVLSRSNYLMRLIVEILSTYRVEWYFENKKLIISVTL